MSFQASIQILLRHIFLILLAPRIYLKNTPIPSHRKAYMAFVEFGKYLNELVKARKEDVENGNAGLGDLLSALVKSNYESQRADKGGPIITEQEVQGNCFTFLFAGHESSSNILQYTIMMLALRPKLQVQLQDEIDRILGDREPDYERDYQALAEGWCGAMMNETLRCFTPPQIIPRKTNGPQAITFNNQTYIIPNRVEVYLHTTGLHRNPKYWAPVGKSESDAQTSGYYKPERWRIENKNNEAIDYGEEESMAPQGKNTEKVFYRPYRGSFLPFSEGPRACIGRKFANVEFVATLSTLFREYSVELEVKEGEKYEEAKIRAWAYVESRGNFLTLRPKGPDVGICWVRRGEERYFTKERRAT